ncbi:MAG TPA: hypothetical protein PLK76_04555 [bacterium]|nr:hypothetical protein [bacterium]
MKPELPTNLEFNVMDYIYQALTRDGRFSSQKAERISANLGFSEDLELIRTSKYINVLFTNAEESFVLTALGKKYMEHFYHLVKRNYSDLAGVIKDGEMINPDKRNRARQRARENMKDWNSSENDSNATEKKEEIFKLEPQIYGVGVNLKALWRKIFKNKK